MHSAETVNRVHVSHRTVLRLALPLTLANITTPLLGLADTAIIGRLGEAHLLGAVATAATVVNFMFWLLGFLRMGTAGLTAQAFGAKDAKAQRIVLARALSLAGALGLALIALHAPLGWIGFRLIDASPQVTAAAHDFFEIRIYGAPFALANYVILGALVGAGRTGHGLIIQVVLNLLNILFNLVFVLALGWGIRGAAAGTLLAEWIATGLGLLVLRGLGWRLTAPWRDILEPLGLRRMMVVNRDIMLRTAAVLLAFGFFTAQGARGGDVTLAANAILMNIFMAGAFFLDGFATAAEQMSGQSLGARDEAGFRKSVRLGALWCVAFGLIAFAGSMIGGKALIAIMTTNEAVRAAANDYLLLAALAPLLGAPAFLFDGIFIGATWTRDMRNLMAAALAIYLAAFMLLKPLGNEGLWIAFVIFMAARGALQAMRYRALTRQTFARLRALQAN